MADNYLKVHKKDIKVIESEDDINLHFNLHSNDNLMHVINNSNFQSSEMITKK